MGAPRRHRHDPLYRVIEETDEMRIAEGSFRDLFDRLRRVANLGVIPHVLRMANYPKYEHTIGTHHQVEHLLSSASHAAIPEKYRRPLRLASVFMHTGHFPLTYSTERALLISANLGQNTDENRCYLEIKELVAKVCKSAKLENVEDHCADLLNLRRDKELYRFYSGKTLIDRWPKLNKRLPSLKDADLSTALRDLIDPSNDGYRWLTLTNQADYVQRDALYFGTVRLDISPHHLYGKLRKYNPRFASDEETLMEYSIRYLSQNFYEEARVVIFSRLYEKILASVLQSKQIDLDWLQEMTDEQITSLLTDGVSPQGKRLSLSQKWTKRANALFDGEFSFSKFVTLDSLRIPDCDNAIEAECLLAGISSATSGAFLSYPFDTNILIDVRYAHDYERISASPRPYKVTFFRRASPTPITEILKFIERIQPFAGIDHQAQIRDALGEMVSWTRNVRFDNVQIRKQVRWAIEEIHKAEPQGKKKFLPEFFEALTTQKKFDGLWHGDYNVIWRFSMGNRIVGHADNLEKMNLDKFVEGFLNLPTRLLQYASTRASIQKIIDKLTEKLESNIEDTEKGDVFEARQLLRELIHKSGRFHVLMSGCVVRDPELPPKERDLHEFDIIRFELPPSGPAEITIYACSISSKFKEDNQDQLYKLVHHIHSLDSQAVIRSHYIRPKSRSSGDWSPKIEGAGFAFN